MDKQNFWLFVWLDKEADRLKKYVRIFDLPPQKKSKHKLFTAAELEDLVDTWLDVRAEWEIHGSSFYLYAFARYLFALLRAISSFKCSNT